MEETYFNNRTWFDILAYSQYVTGSHKGSF